MKGHPINVIVFLCNWGPHSAYHLLQDNGYRIPSEVKMVRIPCSGRISKALLFKAFEMGADGVALVGCRSGTCRYGSGTVSAEKNSEDTRKILDLIGLGRERMRLATFLPDGVEALSLFLADFCGRIEALGKSPIVPQSDSQTASISLSTAGDQPALSPSIAEVIARHDVHGCMDCGKCTASCPLSLSGKPFSPRALVNAIVRDGLDSEAVKADIQACLTCGICHARCPADVDFPAFVRDIRDHLHRRYGDERHQPHGGFFQSMMRAMASPGLKPNRWEELPGEIRLDPQGKILFFGGCSPYFDAFFKNHQEVQTGVVLTDALRLLNFFDVHPRVLSDERCCGHDLLWSGDRDSFLRLARLNIEQIHDLGIEEVITACPECCHSLGSDYEQNGLRPRFKVTHLYSFLEKEIGKGAVSFNPLPRRVTYQDSCRLNRLAEVRDAPRKLLHRMAMDGFAEMPESGRSALCCGNCAWSACDMYNKALQVKRLRQARATGSDLLLTSCPKCQIHLRCAMQDPFLGDELRMEMADLTSLIAGSIRWE